MFGYCGCEIMEVLGRARCRVDCGADGGYGCMTERKWRLGQDERTVWVGGYHAPQPVHIWDGLTR